MTDLNINKKYNKLKEYIKLQEKVIIAFSSGVDSTFLLKTAQEVLKDSVIAVTAASELFPEHELYQAKEFCRQNNIKHIIIPFKALQIKDFKNNPKNRCYICKKALFSKIKEIAEENNTENILEGSNLDDDKDFRP